MTPDYANAVLTLMTFAGIIGLVIGFLLGRLYERPEAERKEKP